MYNLLLPAFLKLIAGHSSTSAPILIVLLKSKLAHVRASTVTIDITHVQGDAMRSESYSTSGHDQI